MSKERVMELARLLARSNAMTEDRRGIESVIRRWEIEDRDASNEWLKRKGLEEFVTDEKHELETWDAELHFWQRNEIGGLRGVIFNDRKNRFPDGDVINTSPIRKYETTRSNDEIVITQSGTRYLLVPAVISVANMKRGETNVIGIGKSHG